MPPTLTSLLQTLARLLTCRGMQVRKVAEENGVDVSESIKELEDRAKQVPVSAQSIRRPPDLLLHGDFPKHEKTSLSTFLQYMHQICAYSVLNSCA